MKVDRLISIINLLNNNGRMTTKELASHFEVSTKTIQRDMEAIEMAGIPLVTHKGYNGGYEILENFRITKSVMNKEEAKILKKLLEGISISYESKEIKSLNEKLSIISDDGMVELDDKLILEFSHWGSNKELKEKITLLDNAIDSRIVITFNYVNLKGEKCKRSIEPYRLVYKGSNWYVYGFCLVKNDFRLFKIRRIKDLIFEDITFVSREIKKITFFSESRENNIELVLKVNKTFLGFLDDIYEDFIIMNEDEEFIYVKYYLPEDNWLYGMLLSMGEGIEVLEPKSVREIISNKIKLINDKYNKVL
ncbi:MAG: helix-turn-helix transcriptional regulator [Clostridium sp.]